MSESQETSRDLSSHGARLVADADADTDALHHLLASRARIQAAMDAHVRETASPIDAPPGTPRSLGQRLLQQAQRLPVIRAFLAIRRLRQG